MEKEIREALTTYQQQALALDKEYRKGCITPSERIKRDIDLNEEFKWRLYDIVTTTMPI